MTSNNVSPAEISVVIPAYNAEQYIREAIESVHQQTCAVSNLIVIDDGSTDRTGEIARSISNVRYARQDNGGVASALNHGARIAGTELIAFLSADDIWKADKIERQLAAIETTPNGLVFGHMQHFVSPEMPEAAARTLACPPDPMPAFSAGTLLTRLDTLRAVGPFDESFQVGEFIDWYGRAKDLGVATVMLDAVVSMRRVHASNHSVKSLRTNSYAPVLKAMMDRRRALRGQS